MSVADFAQQYRYWVTGSKSHGNSIVTISDKSRYDEVNTSNFSENKTRITDCSNNASNTRTYITAFRAKSGHIKHATVIESNQWSKPVESDGCSVSTQRPINDADKTGNPFTTEKTNDTKEGICNDLCSDSSDRLCSSLEAMSASKSTAEVFRASVMFVVCLSACYWLEPLTFFHQLLATMRSWL